MKHSQRPDTEKRTNGRAELEGEPLEAEFRPLGPGRWSYHLWLGGRALREDSLLEMKLLGDGGWLAVRCVLPDENRTGSRSPLIKFALDVATEEAPARTYLFPPEEALFRWPRGRK